MSQRRLFDHERLNVYRTALDFNAWLMEIYDRVPARLAVRDQIDRAATAIPLNIAEGNGKYTVRDRCRFLDIARGSALECAACLDLLSLRQIISKVEAEHGKELLLQIVSILVGLIKSLSEDRVHEESGEYGAGQEYE